MASVVSMRAGDRGCVLQRSAGYLGRVDDTGRDQVLVLVGAGVVAKVRIVVVADLAHDHSTFLTGIADDLAKRLFQGATDDRCTDLLVTLELLDQLIHVLGGAQQSYTTTRDNAFLNRSAGSVHGILNASLLLLHLGLGCRALP